MSRWATWILQGTVAGDNAGGADYACTVTPGVGNELDVLYGDILHNDTSGRLTQVVSRGDGDEILATLIQETLTNARRGFPDSDTRAAPPSSPLRLLLSGGMNLIFSVDAMAQDKLMTFALCGRINGGVPTVATTVSAGTKTETINTNKVI